MSTIQDVINRSPKSKPGIAIIGGMGGGEKGIREIPDPIAAAFQNIGYAIAEDFGLSYEEASELPQSTKLGPKAEKAFQEFRKLQSMGAD